MPALDVLRSLPSLTGRRSRTARSLLGGLVLGVGLFTAAPAAHARAYEDVLMKDSTYYWRLGVPSGGRDQRDGVDSSLAYGHQVQSGEPGALAAGDDGSVRLFGAVPDGVWESHLTLDTSPGAARGRRPFGFEIWVKPASLDASTRRIVSAENASGGSLVGARSDRLVFSRYARTRGGTTWNTIAVAPPAIGRWTHIVASYDGAVMRLYVNGPQAGSPQSKAGLRPRPGGRHPASRRRAYPRTGRRRTWRCRPTTWSSGTTSSVSAPIRASGWSGTAGATKPRTTHTTAAD